ncbi:type VI secretion system protein TssL, long form [uncultured Roseobacter sp.]|uniref:type VI secretion system protein TssL, long form n=1 Tax=uncultured Roseobacter sp. TaxID=114847 RepID=UPI00260339B3|nr:type VI secretion system protein TssL, long form [uncultured Roseobacter sp.]
MNSASDPPEKDPARIILPTPGKPRAAPPPEAEQTPTAPEPEPIARLSVPDILAGFRLDGNQLPAMVAEASPLLNLAHALRDRDAAPDMSDLRRETIRAVKGFESALSAAGILPQQARAAHYVVCATLDDVIRNRPWGEGWAVEGLVSTFHHDVTGGDKVFELLAHFQTNPGTNRDLLLLIYLCLSLGFEGRTRVSARGGLELAQIRDNLYNTLRTQFGGIERDLSPHWQGEQAAHTPLQSDRLFWLITGLLLLGLALLFLTFSILLGRASNETLSRMATLPPGATPTLEIPEPPPEPEPPVEPVMVPPPPEPEPVIAPPPPEPPVLPIETFISFLQPEVEEGLVRIYRQGNAVMVRVANSGAFGIGGARVEPEFLPIFDRIGQALTAEDFDVTVLGHTDNLPIRSAPFPSNFHLSKARASAVRDILASYIGTERIDVRGEADTLPLADNATAEGREINRRTEIIVRGAGEAVDPALLSQGRGDVLDPIATPDVPEAQQ